MAKFNLDPESEEPTQPPLSGTNVDFKHSIFKALQQVATEPATIKDLRGDYFLDAERERPRKKVAIEGSFRSPIFEDFIVPPTLSEETCIPKIKFLRQGVQKLQPEQTETHTDRYTDRQSDRQTHRRTHRHDQNITYPHMRVVKMNK